MSENVVVLPTEEGERVHRMTGGMCAGEESAFEEFYDCYYDRLFRYLLLLTRGNEDLTRELVQATMIKAVQKPRPFSNEAQLWNWVAAIARNTFVDWVRRRRSAPHIVSLLAEDDPEMTCALPDSADSELLAALENCMRTLEEDDRELIESFYFKQGSHRSLAEQEGTTTKAVESKLARVRQKLRRAILKRLQYENE